MTRSGRTVDLIALAAAAVGIGAVLWLAPLMADQFVLFADQEQTRRSAEARGVMVPVGLGLAGAAALVAWRPGPWHGVLASLPASIAVPLALIMPSSAFQLVAYLVTAPIAVGALLAAAMPLPRSWPPIVPALALIVVGSLFFLGSGLIAAVAVIGGVVWWALSRSGEAATSAVD